MKRLLVGTTLILILAAAASASAQEVEFNYNGRIKTGGHPFDGTGTFKFSLVSRTADITFWANDGAALDGSEPTSSVLVLVENGLFSVDIGDTEIDGMAALDASLFNGDEKVFLRTWFSDGVHGFELLQPDRKVTNPALLGSQSHRELDIYVNPATGNDRNGGSRANRAKRTIQAAWDALPPLIQKDVTIHLADGIYRESVNMEGKTAVGSAKITLLGNETSATLVRITGADAGAETTPVRIGGLTLTGQKSVVLDSLLLNFYSNRCVLATNDSIIEIRDCVIANTGQIGVHATNQSAAYLCDVELYSINGSGLAVGASNLSVTNLSGCWIHDCSGVGVFVYNNSHVDVTSCVLERMSYYAFAVAHCGTMSFAPNSPKTVVRDSNAVFRAQTNSTLQQNVNNVVRTNIAQPDSIDGSVAAFNY